MTRITYPDVNGAIGILFEQASSRGHAQQTNNGILRFPFTIRNQFVTTLSTLEAAKSMRKEFLDWQREFYQTAVKEAAASPVKSYLFGDENDPARTEIFVNMLHKHQIDIFPLEQDVQLAGKDFRKGSSYMVPTSQSQYRLIRGIFEKTLEYKDSLFYDITAWTMPLAFGLPYTALDATQNGKIRTGEKLTADLKTSGRVNGGPSNYGYLVGWSHFYAPAFLYELQQKNILVRVATNKFSMNLDGREVSFPYGTLQIPVSMQSLTSTQIYEALRPLAEKYGITVQSIKTGNVSSGSDLGSSRFIPLVKPSVAMIVGSGVNALDAGEIWHLLDQRFNMPLSHLEVSTFNRVDLSKYNTLILVGPGQGASAYSDLNKEKLKSWIQGGGTLILTEEAVSWAAQNGITNLVLKKQRNNADSLRRLTYVEREQLDGAQQMSGAIFKAEVDLTHPLAYGYTSPEVSLFKANKVFLEKSKNQYASPFYYREAPLQSGWLSRENYETIKNSAAVIVQASGTGRIISIADNPNLRAFWLGGSKLMMNAIFFGRIIDAASARAEE